MLQIALAEVGVEEQPRGSNRGPRVDQYQAATNLAPKDWGAWCAAFVCWCMMQAMAEARARGVRYTFNRMVTASVRGNVEKNGKGGIRAWSLAQDDSTSTRDDPGRDILPADIILFSKFSHVAIAVTAPDAEGYFETVEGNTNDKGGREGYIVVHKTGAHRRNIKQVGSRVRIKV